MQAPSHVSGRFLPTLSGTSFPVRLLVVFLLLASGAWAQGPGLYKDGKKVLDLRDMVEDLPQVQDKALDTRDTRGQELYEQVMGPRELLPARPLADYLAVAERCRVLCAELTDRSEDQGRLEALLMLEGSLVAAHQRVKEHFDRLEDELATSPLAAAKISRLQDLERSHLPRARELLDRLAEFREAGTEGNVFVRDRALRDLNGFFAEGPYEKVPAPVDEGFRPLPMRRIEAAISSEVPGVRGKAYPPRGTARGKADPADLEETVDVRFSDEIVALAASLGNSPVAMYYHVRDNCAFEPYLGSRRGAAQTLEHLKGNDYDQASLLIALLRASGYPARYATGRGFIPMDRVQSWLGFTDKSQAASLLATAGMQGTLHIVNSDTTGVSCRRIWVEAFIPYSNYRGAVNDSSGMMWIPMDPAFVQHEIQWGHNLPEDMGLQAETWVEDYYSTFRSVTPGQKFENDLEAAVGSYYPGATLAELVDRKSVLLEPDGIIPGTLPWEVLEYDGSFSELSPEQRYRIRFNISGGGSTLDFSTSLPEIALKQLTVSYVGATTADQDMIDAAGGVFGVADPYLVDVVPVLKLNGCEVARGSGAVMMGTTQTSEMHFTAPVGGSNQMPLVSNSIQAGNYQGIGIDPGDAIPRIMGSIDLDCQEDLLGAELHQTALTYLNNVDTAEDLIADYLHNVLLNDVSEAIVENAVTVMMSGGYPVTFTWDGMIVDADRKIIGPFATDGRSESCQQMRLAGADGSFQENRVFELRYDEEAISTIKILSLAADSLITICHLTNSTADCPELDQPADVIASINAALARGHEVIIPSRQFKYHEWEGTAWIDMDPETCAAGYIISGGHNGGATVQEWEIIYPNLHCLEPDGEITVSPAAEGDYYFAESSEVWTFTVPNLIHWGRDDEGNCENMLDGPQNFVLNYSVAELARIFGSGQYTFTAGSPISDCGCGEQEKVVTIVELEEISVSSAAAVDDKDNNPFTTVKVVSVTHEGDVTAIARLNPSLNESQVPSSWRLTGGAGSQDLERTVETENPSLTEFRFDYDLSQSRIKTDLYVYSTKLELHVDADDVKDEQDAQKGIEVGHSWWVLSFDNDIRDFIMSTRPDLNKAHLYGEGGFWPTTDDYYDCPGEVRFNSYGSGGHPSEANGEWDNELEDALSGVTYVKNFSESSPRYKLFTQNCTDIAVKTGEHSGKRTIPTLGVTTPRQLYLYLWAFGKNAQK